MINVIVEDLIGRAVGQRTVAGALADKLGVERPWAGSDANFGSAPFGDSDALVVKKHMFDSGGTVVDSEIVVHVKGDSTVSPSYDPLVVPGVLERRHRNITVEDPTVGQTGQTVLFVPPQDARR